MGLVWQALAQVKSAALQVVRHLDCRQGLPVDSLEPPSSYAPVSSTGVDAASDAHVAVHVLADVVAEELPHEAPPSPQEPSPLKSVLRSPGGRRNGPEFVDRSPIPAIRTFGIRSLFTGPTWPGSWGLLDFSLLTPAIDDPSVHAFSSAVASPAAQLKTQAQEWKKPTLTVRERRAMLEGIRHELRSLMAHTQAFMKTVASGQIEEIGGNDAEWQLEKLENKLINLRVSEARINAHIEEQEAMLRAGIEVIPVDLPAPLPRIPRFGTEESSSSDPSADDSSSYTGLDFEGIDTFERGDTAAVVNQMRDPLCELLEAITELEDQAEQKGQTLRGKVLAGKGLIECLSDLQTLLSSHLAQYGGSNSRFKEWMNERLREVQLELDGMEAVLARLNARPAAGPQPG